MALLPPLFRPSMIIRRKAVYSGILGESMFWKGVAIVFFGEKLIKKLFGKNPEIVDVSRLGPERFMTLTTAKPVTRRRRRALRKRGVEVPTLKEQKAYGLLWAAKQDAAKRAS